MRKVHLRRKTLVLRVILMQKLGLRKRSRLRVRSCLRKRFLRKTLSTQKIYYGSTQNLLRNVTLRKN